ncbi:hypothetical protein GR702_01745 [Novosphingobium sp. FGD1]|jgi:hypothetical protein|uniref:Uncharacterized protein n=1 Tax=Novosphingobium silvae TaxID=2692619 RepID=A0A7X4GEW5_9SPHN|nr:hypothetical protein [Novosphingobium silvae]MYL96497.1 hypothetical protein [Novosphingobium silvae]
MRIDARNLLDRLGKTDFAYKEFEDRFSELELWPIYEALLRDPRMQAIDQADAAVAEAGAKAGAEPAASAPVEVLAGARPEPLAALFSRYGDGAGTVAERRAPPAQVQDVRAMLRHLSELGSRGEI